MIFLFILSMLVYEAIKKIKLHQEIKRKSRVGHSNPARFVIGPEEQSLPQHPYRIAASIVENPVDPKDLEKQLNEARAENEALKAQLNIYSRNREQREFVEAISSSKFQKELNSTANNLFRQFNESIPKPMPRVPPAVYPIGEPRPVITVRTTHVDHYRGPKKK